MVRTKQKEIMSSIRKYIKSLQLKEHSFKALPSNYFEYPYSDIINEIHKQYGRSKVVDLALINIPEAKECLKENIRSDSFGEYEHAVRLEHAKRTARVDQIEEQEIENMPKFLSSLSKKISDILYSAKEVSVSKLISESINSLYDRVSKYRSNQGVVGIKTCINSLTEWTGGWQPWLITIAARPSIGKTYVAVCEMVNSIDQGYKPVFFSIEMSRKRIVDRMILVKAGVDAERFRKGELSDEELHKVEQSVSYFENKQFIIDDYPYQTADYITNKATQYVNEGLCDIAFVDYIQIVKSSIKDETQKIVEVCDTLKDIPKTLNIPMIALAQINRTSLNSADLRPMLHQLKGSSAIEEASDMVILLHRPWYYGIREDDNGDSTKGLIEFHIPKFRDGNAGKDCIIKGYHNYCMTTLSGQSQEPEISTIEPYNPTQGMPTDPLHLFNTSTDDDVPF